MIHAGGSGVGTAAIQLAKIFGEANVITTAGSSEKLASCKNVGADYRINYKEEQFEEEVLGYTNNEGVDVILDFIGASYWDENVKSIKVDGRWVLIEFLGVDVVDGVHLIDLLMKCVQITGTLLTPRSDAYRARLTTEFSNKALLLFNDKKLLPIVDRVFPLADIQKAHEHMEANKNIGKIIINVDCKIN